jgi:hypothetical protein
MHYISVLNDVLDFNESKKNLERLGLVVKEYENLYLVKYDKNKSLMGNEDVMKCRSIILEKNTNKLVSVAPIKSIDNDIYHKKYIENNANNVIVEEFYDGTMINVFNYKGEFFISTRSCLGAHCKFSGVKTFNNMFNECINNEIINKLDSQYCYSFLLQHPENKIVKRYETPNIILVTTSKIIDNNLQVLDRNQTNKLLNSCNINFALPKLYELDSMEKIYFHIDKLDDTEQGLVLKCYENGIDNRTKIRNTRYNKVRLLKGNSNNKMYLYFELRKNQNMLEYLEYFPEDKELFEKFRLELYDFTKRLFNYYISLKVRKDVKFLEIDYEFRPFLNELHSIFNKTKVPITKNKVIDYLYIQDSARILFAINYNKKKNKKVNQPQILNLIDYPILRK